MSIACAAGRNPPLVPYTLFSRSGRSFTPLSPLSFSRNYALML